MEGLIRLRSACYDVQTCVLKQRARLRHACRATLTTPAGVRIDPPVSKMASGMKLYHTNAGFFLSMLGEHSEQLQMSAMDPFRRHFLPVW
ncbi:hypothetical protein LshimejAT787_1001820 [Lyophyllum shimeji]|uniref:Uncharacterized protein n=1 Tax=Lyophyllum shimeji TaxID=47721 RepID=A0A9P3PUK0_LYOSH|nr:hypothetical protein LshimejAT787_1001820 [Lyophyllum shimeji]